MKNVVIENETFKYVLNDTNNIIFLSNNNLSSNGATLQEYNQLPSSKEQKINLDKNNAWDPVNLSNGEFEYWNTFMQIPWKWINYEFKLDYKNQIYYNWTTWIKLD